MGVNGNKMMGIKEAEKQYPFGECGAAERT
jgi:hypothetical protein